jgi:hypothetical protein
MMTSQEALAILVPHLNAGLRAGALREPDSVVSTGVLGDRRSGNRCRDEQSDDWTEAGASRVRVLVHCLSASR